MAFEATSKKSGKKYYLHSKEVTLKEGSSGSITSPAMSGPRP